jgi:DNA-binding NtrC family response regulator
LVLANYALQTETGGTMPAQIVVVLREPVLAGRVATALIAAGYEAVAFSNSMSALHMLEDAESVELLITSAEFQPKQPNGLALARMTKLRRPALKVIFANGPDIRPHVQDDGLFIPTPTTPASIIETVEKLMEQTRSPST